MRMSPLQSNSEKSFGSDLGNRCSRVGLRPIAAPRMVGGWDMGCAGLGQGRVEHLGGDDFSLVCLAIIDGMSQDAALVFQRDVAIRLFQNEDRRVA